jgi:hypothetical protein
MINCVTIQGVAQRTATGRFIINEIALTTVSASELQKHIVNAELVGWA